MAPPSPLDELLDELLVDDPELELLELPGSEVRSSQGPQALKASPLCTHCLVPGAPPGQRQKMISSG